MRFRTARMQTKQEFAAFSLLATAGPVVRWAPGMCLGCVPCVWYLCNTKCMCVTRECGAVTSHQAHKHYSWDWNSPHRANHTKPRGNNNTGVSLARDMSSYRSKCLIACKLLPSLMVCTTIYTLVWLYSSSGPVDLAGY
jgi:hypothetical protein